MKRLFLFLATNVAVLALLSVVLQVLGVEQWLYREGAGIDVAGLLIFSTLFGISGGIPEGLSRLFMSHPPLEARIAALQRQYMAPLGRVAP